MLISLGDLIIIDISSPTNLKRIGFLPDPVPSPQSGPGGSPGSGFSDTSKVGNYLFITCRAGRLFVADISDLSKPNIIADFKMKYSCNDITIFGNFAYILSTNFDTVYYGPISNSLEMVDISNPLTPSELNEIEALKLPNSVGQYGYSDFIKFDDYLYVNKVNSLLIFQLLK